MTPPLASLQLEDVVHHNLPAATLVAHAVAAGEGYLTTHGALLCSTGKYTGRSPENRFIVQDPATAARVDWGTYNQPLTQTHFDALWKDFYTYLKQQPLYVQDAYIGADPQYQRKVRVITTCAWHSLFAQNMLIQPTLDPTIPFEPDYTVWVGPNFQANPQQHGTNQTNFTVLHLTTGQVLIGGTGYAGEIKKALFSLMNDWLPSQDVLPLHCGATQDESGQVSLFLGLSGTGKTTLSTDQDLFTIGDDEHGWSEQGIFNLEGGCYAKTLGLSAEKEPGIYQAIRFGSVVENMCFLPGTTDLDFQNASKTPNTRAAYPLSHLPKFIQPALGVHPNHLFLLACDAHGVLPPIARLTHTQALYYFLLGYTAGMPGTEAKITEPATVFSPCFGAPFLPRTPLLYAKMLAQRLQATQAQVWLVNTGWTGGTYGRGERLSLTYTRQLVRAARKGELEAIAYEEIPLLQLMCPVTCPGVPATYLNPMHNWPSDMAYTQQVKLLLNRFGQQLDEAALQFLASLEAMGHPTSMAN